MYQFQLHHMSIKLQRSKKILSIAFQIPSYTLSYVITRMLNLVFIQKDGTLEVRPQSMISKVYTIVINMQSFNLFLIFRKKYSLLFL